jgi:hypothetical protein
MATVPQNNPLSTATTSGSIAPQTVEGNPLDAVIWTSIGAAPNNVGRSSGGYLNGYLYLFNSEIANFATALNTTTELWAASNSALGGVFNTANAVTDNAIYLIGGYDGGTGLAVNYLQRFEPTFGGPTGIWSDLAPYPLSVYGACASFDKGNFIYVAGGHTDTQYSLNAYKYDLTNNIWVPIANLPYPMNFSGGAFINGKFHVFGGTDPIGYGMRHVAYDPDFDTWLDMAAVPVPVWFATTSTAYNNDFIFSVGGGGGYGSWPAINAVQVYNPVNNTWSQETPLPVTRGLNFASWTGPQRVTDVGGYASGFFYPDAYRGDGFPLASLNVDITASPDNGPIVIPANGGSFSFTANVVNNGPTFGSFVIWSRIQFPDGSYSVPQIGPLTITPLVGNVINRVRTQFIPDYFPTGLYKYFAYAGTAFPNPIIDYSYFIFNKAAVADGGPTVWEAECTGELFPGEAQNVVTVSAPAVFALKGATPNPFNPTTTISFALPLAAQVNLKVFDLQGRQVADLVNGYREAGQHQVTFDGSNLASGIYLYTLNAGSNVASGKMMLLK